MSKKKADVKTEKGDRSVSTYKLFDDVMERAMTVARRRKITIAEFMDHPTIVGYINGQYAVEVLKMQEEVDEQKR